MIDITLSERKTDECISFIVSCKGHAGYAEKGKDIVCSAISSLLYSFLVYSAGNEDGKSIIVEDAKDENGHTIKVLCEGKHAEEIIKPSFDMMVGGFELIAHRYKDFVTIKKQ